MTRPVKRRRYRSPLRADQARLTRSAIISAAADLFAEKGYVSVSLDAVAEAAGVSRATVFGSVGGKAVLLKEAYRQAFARAAGGGDVAMPLVERPRSREVRSLPTAAEYLSGYAALSTAISAHMAGVYKAIGEAARADAEVQALWETINEERRRGAATIVADVKVRVSLRVGLDAEMAADIVWVLNDPGLFHTLVHRCGWSEPLFEAWLSHILIAELLGG